MPIMSKRNPSRVMHAGEMRKELLGSSKVKLPKHGFAAEVQGYRIIVREQNSNVTFGRKGMRHRILAECPSCGCFIPYGRLAQHEPACKQLDNYSGS